MGEVLCQFCGDFVGEYVEHILGAHPYAAPALSDDALSAAPQDQEDR